MPDEFAEFYAAGFSPLVAQLTLYHGDPTLARSTVEEAFARLLPRWGRLGYEDDPVSWVRRRAWRLATGRWWRLRHKARPVPTADPLRVALAGLPPRQRMAVILADVGDASPAQIGRIADVAEGTVTGWLEAARTTLEAAPSRPGDPTPPTP